jgi:prevent-host-death family protein
MPNMDRKVRHYVVMRVSISEAKIHLPQLIRAVEDGDTVIITRHGHPVASLCPAPQTDEQVVLGGMKDQVKFLPGWDDPIDLDRFLAEGP